MSVSRRKKVPHEDLHGSDSGGRTGVGGERGEGGAGTSLLDVVVGEASGKVRAGGRGRGSRDDVGAVHQRALVVPEDRHLAEGRSERGLELSLVVCRGDRPVSRGREMAQDLNTH